ncbi:OsmC family protein [bacterium]|nr:OsmC family protein [bacterium]
MANYIYTNHSKWTGGHKGHIKMENGVELDFSAPPALHGYPNLLTPEDAFMAAINTCYFMMFIWATERFKINLVSFECYAIGKVAESIDKTSAFKEIVLKLKIEAKDTKIEKINSAIKSARKYSLIAESIKPNIKIEPEIKII